MEKDKRIKTSWQSNETRAWGLKKGRWKFHWAGRKDCSTDPQETILPTIISAFQKASTIPARRPHLTVEWDPNSLSGLFLLAEKFINISTPFPKALGDNGHYSVQADWVICSNDQHFWNRKSTLDIGIPISGGQRINTMRLDTSILHHEYLK